MKRSKICFSLVTGATSGIGYELAKICCALGHNLLLVARNEQNLLKVSNQLRLINRNNIISSFAIDLSKANSAKKLFAHCIQNDFNINVLINNAGMGLHGTHCELSWEQTEQMINLNVLSTTALCHYFGAHMKSQQEGEILNIGSVAAFQPLPYLSAYAASKSFILNFSEALAMEMQEYGVKVSCLCPGATASNFFNQAGIDDSAGGLYSMKMRMSAEKVAAYGIKLMYSKKISGVPGAINKLLAISNRLFSRNMTAKISKHLSKTL